LLDVEWSAGYIKSSFRYYRRAGEGGRVEGRGTILVEIFVLFRILVQEFIFPELSDIQHFVV
jgi:hypothetical protein